MSAAWHPKLEVSRAELALRTVTATIPEIERQIALKENEINTLLGRNPGPIARTSTLLAQEMPVEIPVGLPSTLLERRPDVRAAEQQVRAANAEIGVAIGDFFPRIGLTTFYGGTSTDLDKLLKSEANIWSAAATAAGPVFTGGRLTGRYRQTKAALRSKPSSVTSKRPSAPSAKSPMRSSRIADTRTSASSKARPSAPDAKRLSWRRRVTKKARPATTKSSKLSSNFILPRTRSRGSKPRAGLPSFNSTKPWAAAGRSRTPSGLE